MYFLLIFDYIYLSTNGGSNVQTGSANHSIPLLSEDEAKKVVETLESKGLTCWYDDSEYEKQLSM